MLLLGVMAKLTATRIGKVGPVLQIKPE
jgi:hypothetical protein